MEHILIPQKRAALLDEKTIKALSKRLNCKLSLSDENGVTIEGAPYDEYNAKNVIQAFGRGFSLDSTYKLLGEDYFFEMINLKEMFKTKEQMMRVKARVIGKEGRAKEYIESVSGAQLSVYGSSISLIGRIDEIRVATTAIKVLLGGGMHKTAYRIMENEKRKIKSEEYGHPGNG